ncbi:MAG: hypothetical protein D3908_08425, partial [Candidatus Electrothrix sp. AUS4]|nr:hypothetical protein [Candidatus Electrothrix sp. AUS4]
MEKKILVAVDGSIYSSNSLDYLIRLFRDDQNFNVDLLTLVSSCCGDQSWMADLDSQRPESTAVRQRKAKATKYLREAKDRLVRNG